MLAAAVGNALDNTVERLSIFARLWSSSTLSEETIYSQAKEALDGNADWANILAFSANGRGGVRDQHPVRGRGPTGRVARGLATGGVPAAAGDLARPILGVVVGEPEILHRPPDGHDRDYVHLVSAEVVSAEGLVGIGEAIDAVVGEIEVPGHRMKCHSRCVAVSVTVTL